MGVGGSAVAKDAADIILLDDEFETLVNGTAGTRHGLGTPNC